MIYVVNRAYLLDMKRLFDGSIIVAIVVVMAFVYNSSYLSYYNCMSQTKSDTVIQKSIDHVSAQCRVFILEKAMVN